MKKTEQEQKMQSKINELKKEIERIYTKNEELRVDRDLYRGKIVAYFKWFVKILGSGVKPSLEWMIADLSKTMNSGEPFYFDTNMKD